MLSALVVAACGGAVGSVATAQTSTSPNPEPLWKAYPLDDGRSGAAAQSGARSGDAGAAASGATTQSGGGGAPTPLVPTDEAGDDPPWLLMVAAAAGGALFVTLLLLLQGRRARKREAELGPVATPDEWPWLKAGRTNGTPEIKVERLPRPAAAFEVDEAREVPRRRFEREAEPEKATNGRAAPAAASRRGPICQVRWSRDEACFYAATTDERVARSPTFDWPGDGPPDEESREARTALRVLSKELRDKGWRPMRVKGADFDEQRWYARRFRLPVAEGEEVGSPPSGSARA